MYGIPNMKLDKSVIERKQIEVMKAEGVVFRTGVNVGVDVKADELKKKEFDRVILTCGASNPRNINAPGRDAKGIYFAVDYLKRVTKSIYAIRSIRIISMPKIKMYSLSEAVIPEMTALVPQFVRGLKVSFSWK